MVDEQNKPKAVVMVMPYRAQVALFDSFNQLKAYFENVLEIDVVGGGAAYGCAFWERDKNGVSWYAIALEDDANFATLVHECSHMVDFIFDVHGVPGDAENTEVRAYTLGELVGDVAEVFGFKLKRKSASKKRAKADG